MQNLKKISLMTLIATLLTGCCWTDHSDTIREVAEPMLQEVDGFYQKHKRHPNSEEREAMLRKAGCEVNNGKCLYKGKEFLIEDNEITFNRYYFKIEFKNSYCSFIKYIDDDKVRLNCNKRPCIRIEH